MSRALDDLCDRVKPQCVELLARLTERRVPVAVITTARTEAQHQLDVATGRSATDHSKHVPATNAACAYCHGTKSHAIDLCPWETWQAHGDNSLEWDAGTPFALKPDWATLVALVKSLGLRSGADWGRPLDPNNPPTPFDPGHAELP